MNRRVTSVSAGQKRVIVAICLVGSGMGPAGLSLADLPEVLAMLPDNVQVVVGTGKISAMDQNWDQFLSAVQLQGMMPGSLLEMMSQGGWDATGLDVDGSMAMALVKGQWESPAPPMVIFLPVTSYDEWLTAHSPAPVEGVGDVSQVTFAQSGTTMFARSAGKYAVIGVDPAMVGSYKAGARAAEAVTALIGVQGQEVVEKNDLFAIVDFDGVEPLLAPRIEESMANVQQMMAMAGAAGGADAQAQMERNMKIGQSLTKALLNQGKSLVVGMNSGGRGVTTSFAMNFKPEGWMAKALPGAAAPVNYLAKLPVKPFMVALSGELSGCDVNGIMEKVVADAGYSLDEMKKEAGSGGMGMNSFLDAKGIAFALYPSPAGIMAGILNQAVVFTAGEGAAMRNAYKTGVAGMNGQTNNGITFTTSYTEAAEQIDGVAVDTYSMAMKFPPEQFQAQQAMGMMYGPAGLRGYVIPTKDGLYTTMSQSKSLATNLLQTAASGQGLHTEAGVKSLDDLLPADASMRVYIGVGTIGSQLAVFVGSMMPGFDFSQLTTLPPIAAGVSVKEGTISGTMVMPAALVKSGWDMAKQMQGMGGENGDDLGEDEPPLF